MKRTPRGFSRLRAAWRRWYGEAKAYQEMGEAEAARVHLQYYAKYIHTELQLKPFLKILIGVQYEKSGRLIAF